MTVRIAIRRLPHAEGLPLPAYATEQSAGMDLYAAVTDPVVVAPGERAVIPSGIAIALPPGYEAQVRARSGLALRYGICMANGVGTIDADYRGEIGVLLLNAGREPFTITRGMRIAQLVIARCERIAWVECELLDETARGAGGFGSTGTTP